MGSGMGMGLGQKFMTRIRSSQFLLLGLGRVRSAIFGLGLENFPSKSKIFSLWVKKISSDRAKKYLDQRWVGLLFIADQKYGWVGSGPISSLGHWFIKKGNDAYKSTPIHIPARFTILPFLQM